MKTAIVLTGHMRFWRQVFANFKAHFIDRFQPDIFIHTWSDEGWWTADDQASPTGLDRASDVLDRDAMIQAYQPLGCVVESLDDLMPLFNRRAAAFTQARGRPAGVISMFYKLKMGMDLLERHVAITGTQYDLVIRMRPDVILHRPFEDFDPQVLTTVFDRNDRNSGIGDMFQIGTLDHVARFARVSLALEQVYAATGGLCPHVTCAYQISAQRLPWREVRFYKSLQRRDGLNTQRFAD